MEEKCPTILKLKRNRCFIAILLITAAFGSGKSDGYTLIKRFVRPDGSDVWVNMVVAPLEEHKSNGSRSHLCLIENISERVRSSEALVESERSKAMLLSHLPGMAFRFKNDGDWSPLYISGGCFQLTGYDSDKLSRGGARSYNAMIAEEYRAAVRAARIGAGMNRSDYRCEYEIHTSDNTRKWVWELGHGIFDASEMLTAVEGIIIDISANKAKEEKICFMLEHDNLTGLYNRTYFSKQFRSFENDSYLPVAVIIADINGLHIINDGYGYARGDAVIRATSSVLRKCCRPEYVLARLSGDEFGILMPKTDHKEAFDTLARIQRACEEYNAEIEDETYNISLSLGCAVKEFPEEKLESVIKSAYSDLSNKKLLNDKSYRSELIFSMMSTVYEKSIETEEHSKRLARLSKKTGEAMAIPRDMLSQLDLFAMLHDIGKVAIDDKILNKPGPLTPKERSVMETQPEIGYRIVRSSAELAPVARYILYHHERWDGKGYPHGLAGEQIPLPSRILAVVDAYDAMTNDRVYRKAMSSAEALAEIRKNSGTQFDPGVVSAFEKAISGLIAE